MVAVSTITSTVTCEDESGCHTDLHAFLSVLEADSSLFRPDRLQERLVALDDLDAAFGGFDFEYAASSTDPPLHQRANVLRFRFEAANSELYESVRSDIVRGGQSRALLQWVEDSASHNEPNSPLPGPGFDYLDELVSGVLQPPQPGEPTLRLSTEMVPYQPTPVRHILQLIATAAIAEDDVFVDLGSGLGHVPLLVSMLTGARSLGVEVQAAYVASAQKCAQSLHLSRVQFTAQDARDADLADGTVFYLYSPFKGSILAEVLSALRRESIRKSLKICSLGPCTQRISNEPWLTASAFCETGLIAVFDSR
jgi:Histone methylation protein DOT1